VTIRPHIKVRNASFRIRDPQLMSILREIKCGDGYIVQGEEFGGDSGVEKGLADGAIVGTCVDL